MKKVLLIIMIYLVLALPIWFLYEGAVTECEKVCGEEYDMVLSATFLQNKVCRCMSSVDRRVKDFEVVE